MKFALKFYPCLVFFFWTKVCNGYVCRSGRKSLHVQRNKHQLQSSLDSNAVDRLRTASSNIMVAVCLSSILFFTPTPSMALNPNPEALEMRRVMQQPAGAPEEVKKTSVKLPSGVVYFDYVIGDGAEVSEGQTVQFQWVLRRSNGYFVDSSSNYGDGGEPFIYRVGNLKKVIAGIDEGIRGMKVGGVRRMNIPPSAAFVSGVGDNKPGPMPAGFGPRRQIETRVDKEVWYFEIKVLKVR